jgi:hypothetical protein
MRLPQDLKNSAPINWDELSVNISGLGDRARMCARVIAMQSDY